MVVYMGLFFVLFSFFKIIHLNKFADSFKKYDILSKVINPYALLYPFVEIILGILFLLNWNIKILSLITIIILTSTLVGILIKLKSGNIIECACLGVVFKIPLSYVTVFENLLMIGMSIVILLL